jgi:N-succinyldiaminopimelate aminotransferase
MNPLLSRLQPYPFERLKQLFAGVTPVPEYAPISLGIGEPKHATPDFIKEALRASLGALAAYPATAGDLKLRTAFTDWLQTRYSLALDPATQVLPVNGSREALFSLAQTVIDATVSPRAGSYSVRTRSIKSTRAQRCSRAPSRTSCRATRRATSRCDYWAACPKTSGPARSLLYVCSPGNPTGAVLTLDDWREALRAVGPPRLRDRLRRVLLARSTSTKPSRRSAASKPQ